MDNIYKSSLMDEVIFSHIFEEVSFLIGYRKSIAETILNSTNEWEKQDLEIIYNTINQRIMEALYL